MKFLNVILFACLLCGNGAIAQKNETPANIKAAFSKNYTSATKVKWEKEGDKFEASFLLGGKKMSAVYNTNGIVEETETKIAVAELPANAQKYALKKGSIKEAAKIVGADGNVKYEAEVKGKDLIFDSNGNFIEEKSEDKH